MLGSLKSKLTFSACAFTEGRIFANTMLAAGGQRLTGRVERIAPAAGSEFSVIRPDNATGNFTKIVQRLPVRISIDPGQEMGEYLAPGLSVIVRVDTGSA